MLQQMNFPLFLTTWVFMVAGLVLSQDVDCPVSQTVCACVYGDTEDIIDCSSRGLTSLPVFNTSDHVWDALLLNNNNLGEINELAFDGLLVKRIFAEEAGITSLAENAFLGLEDTLEELDLEDNSLTEETIQFIRDLPQLTNLTLDHNDIVSLSEDHFINLPSIQRLLLKFNRITEVHPEYVANIPTLTEYDLYGNYINFVHNDSFSSLSQLKKLDLGINYLPAIPTHSFRDLSVLEYLSLWANSFTEIHENDLSTLPETLQTLYLGHNDVSEIPENLFVNLPELSYLNFDLMLLSSLPDNLLASQTNIYQFSLTGNRLDHVPKAVEKLTSLGTYYSDDNMLTEINGDEFWNNKEVILLKLDNNNINFVNQSLFCNSPQLKNVHLQNNAIEVFDSCGPIVAGELFDWVDIYLSGNPLFCGCDILWLLRRQMLQDLDTTICQSPAALAGRSLADIDLEEIQCDLDYIDVCPGVCRDV